VNEPYKGRLSAEERATIDTDLQGGLSVRETARKHDLAYGRVRGYSEWLEKGTLIEPPHIPRILVFDIETAPFLSWTWDLWKTNVIDVEQDWYLLCFAYGWYDLRKDDIGDVGWISIFQDKNFQPDTDDDSYVVTRLWDLLDEAQIVVGQNSKAFDVKKFNARALMQGHSPYSTIQQVDTKISAGRIGRFGSNGLKHLSRQLDITRKENNRGFPLWRECMRGDPEAWKEMEAYNRTDVVATSELYTKLRPWMSRYEHPNLGLYIASEGMVCTNCGNKEREYGGEGFQHRGTKERTNASAYPQVKCNHCGTYSRKWQRTPQRTAETRVDLR
jgi:hypothetical protein